MEIIIIMAIKLMPGAREVNSLLFDVMSIIARWPIPGIMIVKHLPCRVIHPRGNSKCETFKMCYVIFEQNSCGSSWVNLSKDNDCDCAQVMNIDQPGSCLDCPREGNLFWSLLWWLWWCPPLSLHDGSSYLCLVTVIRPFRLSFFQIQTFRHSARQVFLNPNMEID